MATRAAPLLLQRGLLLDPNQAPDPTCIAEAVAFQRSGRRLLLLARKPVRWRPTLGSMDADLGLQQQIHQAFRRAGAELDGTLYLTTGFLARRQSRLSELARLARRYAIDPGEMTAIGSDQTLLDSVVHAGGKALDISAYAVSGAGPAENLKAALAALD